MNTLELILGSICLFCFGAICGMVFTRCCVMSGRADKQLGIKDDEE